MQISLHGDAMNWNQVMCPGSDCQLIIVGETKDGQPFCYEESFHIQKVSPDSFTTILEFPGINPLEKLDHVSFIEYSYRIRGILYVAFVELLQLEIKKTCVVLTLTIPEEIRSHQSRQHYRMNMLSRTPITSRILGTRGYTLHKGIPFSGQIMDISGGGLSFITPNRLFYPLFLELSFLLPDYPEKFVVWGEIVRVSNFSNDSYRVAVAYAQTPETILNQIDQYCLNQQNS
jgi:hypothetical protein